MKKGSSIGSKIVNVIFLIGICIAISFIYQIYKSNYFGNFKRAEYTLNLSEFKRDGQVKYGKHDSYRITSNEYNDAMFYKTISVTPHTPYRISCMVKTENVVTEKQVSSAGAGISIANTTECSSMITGTKNWQKIELLLDSKNRTEVEIGFRLGSYNDNCKGTAWFSDLKLEVGAAMEDTDWKMACFIFPNLDVTIEQNGTKQRIQETITASEMNDMKQNMERAKNSFRTLSDYQMTMNYEIINILDPITSVTYGEDCGYYVAPSDVATMIDQYVKKGEYDYIYIVVKFGSAMVQKTEDNNPWLGLRRNGLSRYWFC